MKHLLLIATLVSCLPALFAEDKKLDSKTKAKPYTLEFCLVSDEKFEGSDMKPYELVHEGQTVKLCCKSCLKDFNKDKPAHMKKLASAVAKKAKSK